MTKLHNKQANTQRLLQHWPNVGPTEVRSRDMQPKIVVRRSQIAQYVGPRVAETEYILSIANVSQMEKDRKSFKS